MLNTKTSRIVAAVILLLLGVIVGKMFLSPKAPVTPIDLGGTTNYDAVDTTDGYMVDGTTVINGSGQIVVGTSGTTLAGVNHGTCNLNLGRVPASVAASTTINVDCQATNMLATAATVQSALPGVTYGDKVFVTLATSTVGTSGNGWVVSAANASGTDGYIHLKLTNFTGAAVTPGTTTTSGVQYWVVR